MMDANPERLSATCILTNMEMMEVFQLERREGGGSFLSRSSPMTMLLEEGNKELDSCMKSEAHIDLTVVFECCTIFNMHQNVT